MTQENNEPEELDDEKLSTCCGAAAYDEIDEYGFGMCMDCHDHAEFTSEQDEQDREVEMARMQSLYVAERKLEAAHQEALDEGIIRPHTYL